MWLAKERVSAADRFDPRVLRAAISSKIACIEVIVRLEVSRYEHSLFQRHRTPVTRPIATAPRGGGQSCFGLAQTFRHYLPIF